MKRYLINAQKFLNLKGKAEYYERQISNSYKGWGYEITEAPRCYWPNWDFIAVKNPGTMEAKAVKVEVKVDYTYHRTGNISVEFRNYKGPSGLALTDKDAYVVYLLPNFDETIFEYIQLPVSQLFNVASKIGRVVDVCDGNTQCFLVKLQDILDITKTPLKRAKNIKKYEELGQF